MFASQLVVEGPAAWIVGIGTLSITLTGIAVFSKTVLLPVIEAITDLKRDAPVIHAIAEEFGDDKGRQTITRKLEALSANDEVSASNQEAMLAKLNVVISRGEASAVVLDATHERLESIEGRVRETRHQMIGEMAKLQLLGGTTTTLVDKIVEVSERLQHVQEALDLPKHRELPPTQETT